MLAITEEKGNCIERKGGCRIVVLTLGGGMERLPGGGRLQLRASLLTSAKRSIERVRERGYLLCVLTTLVSSHTAFKIVFYNVE